MKVVAFNGSPRVGGNTEIMLRKCLEPIEAAGVFDMMIGDPDAGMAAIPAILFNRDDELKVRVWFNTGL